jgi:DNA-binding PadR family transcriptional regulator
MRRKPGALLPLEVSVLDAALAMRTRGANEFHGFLMASEVKDRDDARSLTAYGTLYKALERMERAGYLSSRWEDAELAAGQNRPRRRLYIVTAAGEAALATAKAPAPGAATQAVRS